MMNHGIIPAGPSPDEQWTVSVVHTEEEIEEHLEAFKAVAPYVKTYNQKAEIAEAV
jgi:glutamate-1-semialdehyde aminotransferase